MKKRPYTPFGRLIAHLRVDHDLTQKDLAERLGITATHQNGIEVGRRRPSLRYLRRLEAAFPLEPDQLQALHTAAAEAQGYHLNS